MCVECVLNAASYFYKAFHSSFWERDFLWVASPLLMWGAVVELQFSVWEKILKEV